MEVLLILGQFMAVSKNVCVYITNCLIVANLSYKNCFEYAGLPLTELKKKNSLSLANLSIVSLKNFSTVPAVSAPGVFLFIINFILDDKWFCSSQTGQKLCIHIICIWCNFSVLFNWIFRFFPSRIFSSVIIAFVQKNILKETLAL